MPGSNPTSIHTIYIYIYIYQHPPTGGSLNPKQFQNGTPYHPFGTSWRVPLGWSGLHPPSTCRGRATRTDWPSTWVRSHHRMDGDPLGFPMGSVYLYIYQMEGSLWNQKVTYLMYQVCHFHKEKNTECKSSQLLK